jgi:hypothetical protein
MKDEEGKSSLPDAYGRGIRTERTMHAIYQGPKVRKINDVTFFGKNPDSH